MGKTEIRALLGDRPVKRGSAGTRSSANLSCYLPRPYGSVQPRVSGESRCLSCAVRFCCSAFDRPGLGRLNLNSLYTSAVPEHSPREHLQHVKCALAATRWATPRRIRPEDIASGSRRGLSHRWSGKCWVAQQHSNDYGISIFLTRLASEPRLGAT